MLKIWSVSFLFPLLALVTSIFLLVSDFSKFICYSVMIVETNYDMFLVIDFISLTFMMVVGLVSFSVLVYSVSYMNDSLFKKKFMISMILFISSMFILVFSGDLFWIMVGWDGLGLSSFLLIIFFQNWKSFNSGMVTFLSNRLGDSLIIISLIWLLGVGVSKSIPGIMMEMFGFLFMAGAFSKSAQVPFSAWLPLAMAAPTPVSSLVHSSTLVTAGVYLFIRFNHLLSSSVLTWMSVFSSITIFLAATSSLGEFDLKKIIALSTLSHIGMMMFFISLGSIYSAMFHLLTHAMFKSLLFMISGDLIHSNKNWQDIRMLNINLLNYPTGVSMIVSLSSMVGIPFFAGFFSKEIFLNLSFFGGLSLITFMISAGLTASYSTRILLSLLLGKKTETSHLEVGNWKVFLMMSLSSLMSGSSSLYLFKSWEEFSKFFPLNSFLFLGKKEIFVMVLVGLIFSIFVFHYQKSGWTWFHNMWWILSSNIFFQNFMMYSSWGMFFKNDSKGIMDKMIYSLSNSSNWVSKISMSHFSYFPMMMISISFVMSVMVNLFI